MFDLTGHVAVVTGGNRGLGLAMARGLLEGGAKVAIWSRDPVRNAAAVAQLGEGAAGFTCDVTDEASVKGAMAETLAHFGRVDSMFANAGGSGVQKPFTALTAEDWNATFAINVGSVVTTFQEAVRHFKARGGGGKLVVTSSIAAVLGLPFGGYSASKAAVSGLVRTLAVELGRFGITANAILPGYIPTEMSLDTPQAFRDAALRRSPAGAVGQPEDMAGIAVFLAARESSLINGQSIVIDGGHSIFPM